MIGVLGAAAAAVVSVPGTAAADPAEPPPPPPPPNVNAYAPVKPSDFAVLDNTAYAFSTPDGLTCMLQRSGGIWLQRPDSRRAGRRESRQRRDRWGTWLFQRGRQPFANAGDIKPLPANSRLSYQTLSCGNDGTVTACVDSRNQSGFVIAPAGSFIVGEVNPLVDRPEGTNPYFN